MSPDPARQLDAGEEGRNCPYCRFPLKPGVPVLQCPACRSLHHAECWSDNGGCAVLGCAAAPQAAPSKHDDTQVLPVAPDVPPMPSQARPSRRPWALVAALALVLGAGVATAAILTRHGHSKAVAVKPTARPVKHTPVAHPSGPPAPSKADVRAFLHGYESAYSSKDQAALTQLFTPDVTRDDFKTHKHQQGRPAAMNEYARQFSQIASPSYRFQGVQIVRTPGAATVTAVYMITGANIPPQSAPIELHLVAQGGTLLIDRLRVNK